MAPSTRKNFLYQSAYQILTVLTPLLTTPYLSRVLGASQIGVYSYTQSITNYFLMFAVLGMSSYGVRAIAICGDDRAKRSRIFCSAYISQLSIGILVALIYICYMLLFPQGSTVICLIWGLSILSALLDVSWLLFGVGEFKIPTIRSMITRLGSLIFIFVFVHSADDLWLYVLSISGTAFLNQLLIWPFVQRYIDPVKPTWKEIRAHYLPNLRLFIPVIAVSLYTYMDKTMLGIMSGMEQTGFYEYSERLSKIPLGIITAMGTVMLPYMSTSFESGNKETALRTLDNSLWVMLVLAFAFAFGIAAIAPEFAPVFLGEEFVSCSSLMMVLAIIIPVMSTTNVFGRQYLLPRYKDGLYTISLCIGAVVNIAINLILIPQFMAMGAAIATICAEVSVLIAQAIMVHKELPLLQYAKSALPFFVIGAIMALIVRLAADQFDSLWGFSVQGLIFEIIVGVFVYALLSGLYCILFKDKHFKMLIRKVYFLNIQLNTTYQVYSFL